jgi:hypothetical protein
LNTQNYLKERKPMDDVEVNKSNNTNLKVRRIVYYILGVLEVLFAFRLVLKLLGANPESTFVSIIYTITSVLLAPFLAIFRTATTTGIETKAVLEPSTIIGMIVYALVAWGIVKIIEINKAPKNLEE